MRVHGRRILLGDNRGGRTVMLMLIVLRCDVVQISNGIIFRHFRKIAKGNCELRHVYSFVRPSVRPHGTARLSLDDFREI